jgi:GDP-D-mannose dehydratase
MTSFANAYHGRRVLVAGDTGSKGSWLTTWLLDLGAEICGYSKGMTYGDGLTNANLVEVFAFHREHKKSTPS